MKHFILVVVVGAFILPFSTQAWVDPYTAQGNGTFFFPYGAGQGAAREVMTVGSWGPSTGPSRQSYYAQPYYQPQYYQQPQYYYQPQQYYYQQPQYQYYQQPYYPSSYSTYYAPGYGTSPAYGTQYGSMFGPAYATGQTDFLGTPLCQWYDYSGATSCNYDPHQWVFDPYTGTYY